jgi:dimethylamine--corrinoid protein Co-methyltransferase
LASGKAMSGVKPRGIGIVMAGDLVAWMQLTRKMKINQAKVYVAEKLNVNISDLTNEAIMSKKREEPGLAPPIILFDLSRYIP